MCECVLTESFTSTNTKNENSQFPAIFASDDYLLKAELAPSNNSDFREGSISLVTNNALNTHIVAVTSKELVLPL